MKIENNGTRLQLLADRFEGTYEGQMPLPDLTQLETVRPQLAADITTAAIGRDILVRGRSGRKKGGSSAA